MRNYIFLLFATLLSFTGWSRSTTDTTKASITYQSTPFTRVMSRGLYGADSGIVVTPSDTLPHNYPVGTTRYDTFFNAFVFTGHYWKTLSPSPEKAIGDTANALRSIIASKQSIIGYTPENVLAKVDNLDGNSVVLYPTQRAVNAKVESTAATLVGKGDSNTLYVPPRQSKNKIDASKVIGGRYDAQGNLISPASAFICTPPILVDKNVAYTLSGVGPISGNNVRAVWKDNQGVLLRADSGNTTTKQTFTSPANAYTVSLVLANVTGIGTGTNPINNQYTNTMQLEPGAAATPAVKYRIGVGPDQFTGPNEYDVSIDRFTKEVSVSASYPFVPGSAILQDTDVNQAIVNIEMYNDPTRKYYVSRIGNASVFGSERRCYLQINDVVTKALVAAGKNITGFWKVDSIQKGFERIDILSTTAPIKVIGSATINWNKCYSLNGGFKAGTDTTAVLGSSVFFGKSNLAFNATFSTDRIVAPKNLFITKGFDLQLFKSSFISKDFSEGGKFGLIWGINNPTPTILYGEAVTVPHDQVSNGDVIRVFHELPNDIRLNSQDLIVVKTDTTGISAKDSCNSLCIGDSNTDYDLATYLYDRLTVERRAKIRTLGTRKDGSPQYRNEGRASWEFATLVGWQTAYAGTIYRPTSNDSGNLNQNPFIRVATAGEIAAHPEWCFENTPSVTNGAQGKDRERNWTQSQAAGGYTGPYYTLDWDFYFKTVLKGIDTTKKLVVMCNLGFNDLNHHSGADSVIDQTLVCLDMFCRKLYAYKPNVIIGISSLIDVGVTNMWDRFSLFRERVTTQTIPALQAAGIKVDEPAVISSTNRKQGFDFSYSTTPISTYGTSLLGSSADNIHPGALGRKQMANGLFNWHLSKL